MPASGWHHHAVLGRMGGAVGHRALPAPDWVIAARKEIAAEVLAELAGWAASRLPEGVTVADLLEALRERLRGVE